MLAEDARLLRYEALLRVILGVLGAFEPTAEATAAKGIPVLVRRSLRAMW